MTRADVEERVATILSDSDPERAHGDEDQLLEDVIRHLAPSSELAALLPLLNDSDRQRWYA